MVRCEYKQSKTLQCNIDLCKCDYKGPKDLCPTYYSFEKYMAEALVDIREDKPRKHGKEITDIIIEINLKR
jgi:hypothetical protein